MGRNKRCPRHSPLFADQHGHEIHDNLEQVGDWNDEDDESYQFQVDEDDNELSYDTVDDQPQDTDDIDATSTESDRDQDHEDIPSVDSVTRDEQTTEEQDLMTPSDSHENTGVDGYDPSVADTVESTGVGDESSDEINNASSESLEDTEEADYQRSERLGIEYAQDDGPLLPKCIWKKKADEMYEYYNAMFMGIDIEHMLTTFKDGHSDDMFNFLTK